MCDEAKVKSIKGNEQGKSEKLNSRVSCNQSRLLVEQVNNLAVSKYLISKSILSITLVTIPFNNVVCSVDSQLAGTA